MKNNRPPRQDYKGAHGVVQQAVAKGRLRREPCEICGFEPADAHHIDYNDPLRIMWLCHKHHMQTHSQFGKPAPDWIADIRAAMRRIDAARIASRSLEGRSADWDQAAT